MKFVSIDLENNQPSGRIIQIGVAGFDTDSKTPLTPAWSRSIYTDPGEPINWHYRLDSGGTLGSLLGDEFQTKWQDCKVPSDIGIGALWETLKLENFGKKIVQWGRGDLNCLLEETRKEGLQYPSNLKELNLKRAWDFLYAPGLKLPAKPSGLQVVCEAMNLTFEGRAHDAEVDAINTGRLAVKMFQVICLHKLIQDNLK